MVDALCRTLSSQLVVLAQEGRQLGLLETAGPKVTLRKA